MKPIRIGTRDSQLALWQAETVQYQLELLSSLPLYTKWGLPVFLLKP